MYKVYRITKTPMIETNAHNGNEYVKEFWSPVLAQQAAAKMELRSNEEVQIEYTATLEESLNTDYFD